ncbi:DegT/DnrJ/EryC1/StrS family aminotransferase [Shewanella chilikensis]|uniref:DegT/DnrJ/EryC1/StrS aminotransferase family protein n=1 Tax=Shewanella chilikensis TaxID=558541 RepID=UPI0030072575
MSILLNKPLEPNFKKLVKYLEKVNSSGWYTNFGPLHEELTRRLEEYLNVENLLLVSNGTLAIQVACKVLKVNSAITTPFSFVATTSALLWQGIDTAFSDIDPDNLNLSAPSLSKTLCKDSSYDGVIATHVFGNPCDVNELETATKKYQKKLIYDAAHCFGVDFGEKSILKFGDASTLSFHATKVFHTVEGGAIIFKRKSDYEKAKELINFGIQSDGSLGEPGINAKLNEYQCAVGLTLLDEIDDVIKRRASLFEQYRDELREYVSLPIWHTEASINGAYMPILIENKLEQQKVIEILKANNVQSRRYFNPSLDTAYSELANFGSEISRHVADCILCLPLHSYMNENEVSYVSKLVRSAL